MAKVADKTASQQAEVEVKEERQGDVTVQAQGGALVSYDFGDDAGAGLDNVDKSELKMPFFTLLQSNSPQVEEGPKQIPGAKAGMFYNTLTQELFDGKRGLLMIAAMRARNIVEYTPRDLGGGFLGAHDPSDPAIVQLIANHNRKLGRADDAEVFGKMTTTTQFSSDGKPLDGTEFIDTRYLFSVLDALDAEGNPCNNPFWAMLAFKSTQIDKQKRLVSRALAFRYPNGRGGTTNPPLWAHRWLLQSAAETKKGKTFQGYKLSLFAKNPDGSEAPKERSVMRMDDPLYMAGADLYQAMRGGKVKADFAQQASQAQDGAAAAGDDPDDIPM